LRNAGERFLETAGETLLDLVLAVGLIPAATDSTSSDQNQRAVGYLVDGLLLFGASALAIGELRERNGSVGIIVFSLAIAVITALLAAYAIHLDVLAARDSASARAAPPASLKLTALRF
ncbi:MAG: hypothetical protein JST92_23185, partial [Deltaproteobacteria bacterium]|nr:hypothetical protein [Deltaproteobacteria bacterium]